MKLGIMQPYFFPYLGYFSLIKHVDRFVLLDTVQFIRHGWIERNRILKPVEGWQYVHAPLLKHHRDTVIRDLVIDNQQPWQQKLIAQLQHYRKTAPHFAPVMRLLDQVFSTEYRTVVALNKATLDATCRYLKIPTPIDVFSDMNLAIAPVTAPDEWALNICRAVGGVREYWNPPGGESLFDRSKYDAHQIQLRFQSVRLEPYDQRRPVLEPGLSILDVMLFNSPDRIGQMLDAYELA